MDNYVLSCCSTADLTKAHFDARNIRYICFHYALGDTEYPDDLGQTVSFDEFYRRMEAGEMTRTSLLSSKRDRISCTCVFLREFPA